MQVFLLVLGPEDASAAVARLSLLRIRDFMLSSLDPALAQLELLRPILRAADPVLYDHLPKSQPSFALAGTITMFAHNIQDYKDITRLFDFFLARHAVMPIYLFAAVVLSKREELLEFDKEDEDILYVMLGKLPEPFDVEFHIARTVELYERLPPASLNSWEWWRISSSSVLKSSATNASLRHLTLEDGETFFLQQARSQDDTVHQAAYLVPPPQVWSRWPCHSGRYLCTMAWQKRRAQHSISTPRTDRRLFDEIPWWSSIKKVNKESSVQQK